MMKPDETEAAKAADPKTALPKARINNAEQQKLSRLDRLKLKIKKLQGKDPDIYPMF